MWMLRSVSICRSEYSQLSRTNARVLQSANVGIFVQTNKKQYSGGSRGYDSAGIPLYWGAALVSGVATATGGMPGCDMLMNSGPGGLSGGDFMTGNASILMGHDFSQNMDTGGQYGDMEMGHGQNQMGVDNSRFDTSVYQQMIQQLFSTDSAGQEMKDMGTPFDGNSYNYNTNTGDQYNTAVEASVGSYASTEMSAYMHSRTSGAAGEQTSSQGPQNGNGGAYAASGNEKYSGGSNNLSSGSYSDPFNVNNYDMGHMSTNSDGSSGMNSGSAGTSNAQSPFDSSKFGTSKTPFLVNNNNGGSTSNNRMATGSGPYDTSKFDMMNGYSNTQSGTGQTPFATSNTYSVLETGYNAGSESQYKTPFQLHNYNDLLDNPFQSGSSLHHTSYSVSGYSGSGQSAGYGSSSYGAIGSGPGGNPFNQGGSAMRATNNMRGRRSTQRSHP